MGRVVSVFKHRRGKTYRYDFRFNGKRYAGNTHQITETDAQLAERELQLKLRHQAGGIAQFFPQQTISDGRGRSDARKVEQSRRTPRQNRAEADTMISPLLLTLLMLGPSASGASPGNRVKVQILSSAPTTIQSTGVSASAVLGFLPDLEPQTPTKPTTIDAHPLRLPTLVFAGAAAADWTTTYRNLSPGPTWDRGQEWNPLLSPLHNRPVPTVLAGAALDVVGVWAWDRFVGRKHPKLAAIGLYAGAGLRIWLASRNTLRLNTLSAAPSCPVGTFCRN